MFRQKRELSPVEQKGLCHIPRTLHNPDVSETADGIRSQKNPKK